MQKLARLRQLIVEGIENTKGDAVAALCKSFFVRSFDYRRSPLSASSSKRALLYSSQALLLSGLSTSMICLIHVPKMLMTNLDF